MIQKPDKPPVPAEQSPASVGEIAWIAVLLALCLAANAWITGAETAPIESVPTPAAQASPSSDPAAPERPGRERSDARPDREWRDPSSSALPGI